MVSPDNANPPPSENKATILDSEKILRRVLKSSPQDLWLDALRRKQGPQHDTLVYWMLNQTECDFAIAVHAFYRSNPIQYLDQPRPLPARPGPADIFALVLLNWDTGSYRTHKLSVEDQDANPRTIGTINQKLMARPRGSLPFNIPRQFLEPAGGQPVQVPPYMLPDDARHLWPVYKELGLRVADAPPGIARQVSRLKAFFQKRRQT